MITAGTRFRGTCAALSCQFGRRAARRPKTTAVLALLFVAATLSRAEENLALHRTYDYWPQPTYSHCTDAGDITQLTDGETQYAGGMWMKTSTVGWSAGVNVPVVILFDLGREATLYSVLFNTCGGGTAGVMEAGLRVFVSLDNKKYVLAGELAPPTPPAADQLSSYGIQLQVSLNNPRARYVAVVPMAPAPNYFVFVDEIELMGVVPATPESILPIQSGVVATGAGGLQEVLSGGGRALHLLNDLIAPVERHIECWPAQLAEAQRNELEEYRSRVMNEYGDFDGLRAELTASHRSRAAQVYGTETLVWEVTPDDAFTMLSLPEEEDPPQAASIHTVINALEATALGAANLTAGQLPLPTGHRE